MRRSRRAVSPDAGSELLEVNGVAGFGGGGLAGPHPHDMLYLAAGGGRAGSERRARRLTAYGYGSSLESPPVRVL